MRRPQPPSVRMDEASIVRPSGRHNRNSVSRGREAQAMPSTRPILHPAGSARLRDARDYLRREAHRGGGVEQRLESLGSDRVPHPQTLALANVRTRWKETRKL
jgi:hypothetical protein